MHKSAQYRTYKFIIIFSFIPLFIQIKKHFAVNGAKESYDSTDFS